MLTQFRCFAHSHLFQNLGSRKNSFSIFSRNFQINIFPRPYRQIDGVELLFQFIQQKVVAQSLIKLKFHAQFFYQFGLLFQNILWQTILRNTETCYSSGVGQSIVNGDLMPEAHKIKGSCKPCRAGAYNGNPFSGRRQFLFNQFIVDLVLFSELIHGVCQISVDLALRNRLIQHFTAAAHLTMEVTNPPYRSRQRIIAQRKFKGIFHTVFLN
ncbi:hypothetical protein SDC9_135580 [bioreactor metagenome]|uniref:Uncharacterized protein n=1 Tax=bioreactor metagenome TaxID=1076179 RepID=A0A645DGL3_9ZZZZ